MLTLLPAYGLTVIARRQEQRGAPARCCCAARCGWALSAPPAWSCSSAAAYCSSTARSGWPWCCCCGNESARSSWPVHWRCCPARPSTGSPGLVRPARAAGRAGLPQPRGAAASCSRADASCSAPPSTYRCCGAWRRVVPCSAWRRWARRRALGAGRRSAGGESRGAGFADLPPAAVDRPGPAAGAGQGVGAGTAFVTAVGVGVHSVSALVAPPLERAGRSGPTEVLLRRLVHGRQGLCTHHPVGARDGRSHLKTTEGRGNPGRCGPTGSGCVHTPGVRGRACGLVPLRAHRRRGGVRSRDGAGRNPTICVRGGT